MSLSLKVLIISTIDQFAIYSFGRKNVQNVGRINNFIIFHISIQQECNFAIIVDYGRQK